jgi:hypothetical protein
MTQFFSVVQFLPDPLTGERINIGVVVFDGDEFKGARFLEHWGRVSAFGGNVKSLQTVVEELRQANLTPDSVRKMAQEWRHGVQFTTPRASLAPADRLLEEMAGLMLTEEAPPKRTQAKLNVIREVRQSFERAFTDVALGRSVEIEARGEVRGRHAAHEVDLTIRNGRLLLAAKAVSFDRPPSRHIDKDVAATAWTIEDLARGNKEIALAVLIALPQDPHRRDVRDAEQLFGDLNATVLTAGNVDGYARSFAVDVERQYA